MAEASIGGRFRRFRRRPAVEEAEPNKYLYEALDENKREGLMLAVKARTISLGIIAVFMVYLNPHWSVLYYEILILGFFLIGWAQAKIGRVGRSRAELYLILLDLALMTVVLVVPNPWDGRPWSIAMQYKYDNFPYFYVLLAAATLAYSWRTLFPVAGYTTLLWLGAYFWATYQPSEIAPLTDKVKTALDGYPHIFELLDPNGFPIEPRIQEILVFCIVAGILALNGWRAKSRGCTIWLTCWDCKSKDKNKGFPKKHLKSKS